MISLLFLTKETAGRSLLSNFLCSPEFDIIVDNFSYTSLHITSHTNNITKITIIDFKKSIRVEVPDVLSIELPRLFSVDEIVECIETELTSLENLYEIEKEQRNSVKLIKATHRFLRR
ncbi:TPA: hypothetical protein [Aquificae Joseph's Coat Spring virus]|nr:TPA: hypothetical protein [Aquificae Joseph's Coat Spring virus]